MNALPKILIFAAVLAAIASCGKANESGKSNTGIFNSSYCASYTNGQCAQFNTTNLSQLMTQIPCENGVNGGINNGMIRSQQIIQVQTATLAQSGQSYLGVTSMGDVAIVVGNGTMTAQMTVFVCPGQTIGQSSRVVTLGEFTSQACPIKTITAASLFGNPGLNFRDPRFGRGTTGMPFPFCRQ